MKPLPIALLACCASVAAADYPAPVESDWTVRDFRFHGGEVLPEMRVHYLTVGAPGGEPVLILHGTGQNATSFLDNGFAGQLFGPGQPLDARKYFVILPDAVGHGKSAKPSDGMKMRFPHYNYDDMVVAQYRLVTEHLGIRHLRLVLGTSMGGMHTWIWGEMYPDFMDALVPMATEPAPPGGRNWMMRRMVIDAIRNDPEWKDGNYEKEPRAWRPAQVFYQIATTGGALALYRNSPTREKADAELDRRLAQPGADANDVLYQMDSFRDYDPSPGLEKIRARVLAVNSADDERNPPELGVMEQAMKRIRNGRYVLIPIGSETVGHGTSRVAKLWQQYLAELLAER